MGTSAAAALPAHLGQDGADLRGNRLRVAPEAAFPVPMAHTGS